MIINNFDIICVTAAPDEAYPPLIVDSDTVLPLSISVQCLQMIGGRNSQGIKLCSSMQHIELDGSFPLNSVG